jgi:hypothetical protein
VVRVAIAAFALLLATCAAAETPRPNVRGVVVGGPVTICPSGEPCDPPPKAIFVAFSRAGHTPVRARIGPTGQLALYLRPARYTIRLSPPQGGRLTPTNVRVPVKSVVRLRLVVH